MHSEHISKTTESNLMDKDRKKLKTLDLHCDLWDGNLGFSSKSQSSRPLSNIVPAQLFLQLRSMNIFSCHFFFVQGSSLWIPQMSQDNRGHNGFKGPIFIDSLLYKKSVYFSPFQFILLVCELEVTFLREIFCCHCQWEF